MNQKEEIKVRSRLPLSRMPCVGAARKLLLLTQEARGDDVNEGAVGRGTRDLLQHEPITIDLWRPWFSSNPPVKTEYIYSALTSGFA